MPKLELTEVQFKDASPASLSPILRKDPEQTVERQCNANIRMKVLEMDGGRDDNSLIADLALLSDT